MSSAGMVLSVPNPIRESPRGGVVGPIAALEQCAATLLQRAIQAAAVARDAVADAADINSAHATIVAQHRKMFLARAFGINPDGTAITDPSLLPEKLKLYKSIKSVKQYNYIIEVLSNWGDNAVLKEASPDDPDTNACWNYCKENIQGYSYVKLFVLEEAEGLDRSLKKILKHKKSGGILKRAAALLTAIRDSQLSQG